MYDTVCVSFVACVELCAVAARNPAASGQLAVSEHAPVPDSIVTVVPEMLQTVDDDASTVIVAETPALVVASTVNVELYAALAGALRLTSGATLGTNASTVEPGTPAAKVAPPNV